MPHHHTSQKVSFTTILKWQFSKSFRKRRTDRSNLPILSQEALPEGEYALWLGHASLWLKLEETTVAIDPVLGNIPLYRRHSPLPLPKEHLSADVILITHAHYDHFSPKDIAKIIKDDTVLIAPSDILSRISIPADRKVEVKPNQSYEVKGFRFSTVPAYNIKPERLNFHPKANNWVGYIFELNDKKVDDADPIDVVEDAISISKNSDLLLYP